MFYSEKMEALICTMHPFHCPLKHLFWAWWIVPIIPALEKQWQEGQELRLDLAKIELQVSLGYMNLSQILIGTGAWWCTLVILALSWLKQDGF